jgi:hypothetical protein
MKSLIEIRSEIENNNKSLLLDSLTKKKKTSISKQNKFLREMMMYIETNPREDYLIKEREKLQNIIKSKEDQYIFWSANICDKKVDVNKRRALFNKEIGLIHTKKQIKTLNFILK